MESDPKDSGPSGQTYKRASTNDSVFSIFETNKGDNRDSE